MFKLMSTVNIKRIFLLIPIGLAVLLILTFFFYRLYSQISPSQKLLNRLEDVKEYPDAQVGKLKNLKIFVQDFYVNLTTVQEFEYFSKQRILGFKFQIFIKAL